MQVTTIFVPNLAQLDLRDGDKRWLAILDGEHESYTGEAIKPDYLSGKVLLCVPRHREIRDAVRAPDSALCLSKSHLRLPCSVGEVRAPLRQELQAGRRVRPTRRLASGPEDHRPGVDLGQPQCYSHSAPVVRVKDRRFLLRSHHVVFRRSHISIN